MRSTRQEVYYAIDTERNYQDSKWNKDTTSSGGFHEVAAWILFMEEYLNEARVAVSRGSDPEASIKALNSIRKVAALAVACMEQKGAYPR